MLEQARELKRSSRAPRLSKLIMNDRADLCLAADFDGVHVGQDDLSPESVRENYWAGTLAWSFYSQSRAIAEADRTSADYLAIGPVFATSSKDKPDPVVGLEGVRRAQAIDAKAAGGDWRDHAGELPRL